MVIYLTRSTRWYKFSWLVPVLGCVALWAVNDNAKFYFESPKYWALLWITAIMLCSVPFQRENQPYMFHKFSTAFNIIVAELTGCLILGILFAVMLSVKILFGIAFSENFYLRSSFFVHFFFVPLFFLVFQQRQTEKMTLNRWLDILLNFIAIPALMIFTALLYAYVGKILLATDLPKGMVSNIVLPYLIAGLAIYCLRVISAKPRWNGFFRFYPYLAIVPFVLLYLAIERRISDYGWTEHRIYLVAMATALLLCYATLFVQKTRQYRYSAIIVIAAVFSMTYILNPQEIEFNSQIKRFEMLAEKLDLFDENRQIKQIDFDKLTHIDGEKAEQYQALSDITWYLLYGNKEDIKKLEAKYGQNISNLSGFDGKMSEIKIIKDNALNEMLFNLEQEHIDWDISDYKRLIRWESGFVNTEYETTPYQSTRYCLTIEQNGEEESFGCLDLDEVVRTVFKKHGLDVKTKQSYETLKKLNNDFLTIEDKAKEQVVQFDSFHITFHKTEGYIFSYLRSATLLIK
ncbi:DUF4153 domain-containing protein [Actinobacillus arthritidis]|nr:DUF4153 domain-containing protein [Actinobacillus arthritidis]WGE89918.1 DUF4153 domain-containing protein [Actinobacillus arthritidis]